MNYVLVVTGTCGSGKTTIASLIGQRDGWAHSSEDKLWLAMFGRDCGAFGSDEHIRKREAVHAAVFRFVLTALADRRSVVIDATVHEAPPSAFYEYRDFFEATHIAWVLRVLHPALAVAIERDARRCGWHAGPERVAKLRAKFNASTFDESTFTDTSSESAEVTLQRVLAAAPNPSQPTCHGLRPSHAGELKL